MNEQKVAIFDFDGTIGNIEPLIREIYGEVSTKRGWPTLTDEAYRKLRGGTISDAIKWVGVRPWQLPGLMREARSLVYDRRDMIELFPGIPELLRHLHRSGWNLYILSANSTKTIHAVLKREKLDSLVQVLKRPALLGKSRSINKLVKSQGYQPENVWMIGDEVRDVEASHKSGIRSISVTWGLQDKSILQTYKPTAIAHTAKDVETILTTE